MWRKRDFRDNKRNTKIHKLHALCKGDECKSKATDISSTFWRVGKCGLVYLRK